MEVYIVCGVFILFDIVSGFLKAVKGGEVNSSVLREGLFHKAAEVLALIFATTIEYASPYISLPEGLPLVAATATYLCVMEGISVVENLCAVNPALSKLFSKYLEKVNKE